MTQCETDHCDRLAVVAVSESIEAPETMLCMDCYEFLGPFPYVSLE